MCACLCFPCLMTLWIVLVVNKLTIVCLRNDIECVLKID